MTLTPTIQEKTCANITPSDYLLRTVQHYQLTAWEW